MAFNIEVYQGDTLPLIDIALYDYSGAGAWLEAGDTVQAKFRHFDYTESTVVLTVVDYGTDTTPSIVTLPTPCSALSPASPGDVVAGQGDIILTRVTQSGDRESIPDPITYNVEALSLAS